MTVILLLVSISLIVLCGLFVAAEFSLIAVNKNTVDRLAEVGDHGAIGIKKAISSLNTQLSGAQIGITLTSLTIGFLAEPAIATLIGPILEFIDIKGDIEHSISVFIGIAIATVVTMIFGELIPKNLALINPLKIARIIQKPIRAFSGFISFPIIVLNSSANFILGFFGIEPQDDLKSARSADELLSLVRHSSSKGTLAKDTAAMLERSLNFGDLTAAEVMTPRVRLQTISKNDSISKVLLLAKNSGLSRFPVTDNGLDNIVGVVHIKHVLSVEKSQRDLIQVSEIMKQPIFVPSNIQLEPLLVYLRKGGLQMAIVIDEFGGTDGIVTIEDLFEELVGDVRDEYDREKNAIRRHENNSWTFSGLLRPDEISEEVDVFLPEAEDSDTIAGLIIYYLERMPRVGDEVFVNAIRRNGDEVTVKLLIEKMESHRVDSIRMMIIKKHKNDKVEP